MNQAVLLGVAIWVTGGVALNAQSAASPMLPATAPSASSPAPSPAPSLSAPAMLAARPAASSHNVSLEVTTQNKGSITHVGTEQERNKLFNSHPPPASLVQLSVTEEKVSLQVSIRNFAMVADALALECYYIGGHYHDMAHHRAALNRPDEFVYDRLVQPVNLGPGATVVMHVESKELRVRKVTQPSDMEEYGSKPHGWIVRLVADGKVLALRGSTDSYENVAKDESKFAALLAK